jgi:hypothetical protein
MYVITYIAVCCARLNGVALMFTVTFRVPVMDIGCLMREMRVWPDKTKCRARDVPLTSDKNGSVEIEITFRKATRA